MSKPSRRCIAGVTKSPYFVLLVCFLSLFSHTLNAQVAYGVNGTVTDTSGAVIPGAQIVVRADATGVVTNAVSSPAGAFTVVLNNTGSYSVTVSAPGFKQFVAKSVGVEVGTFSTVNAMLQPGAATDSVQVTAQEISLNTADPGIGTTIEPALINSVPIEVNGGPRSIDTFVLQTVGTAAVSSAAGTGIEGNALNINGGITAESGYYYDGIPVTDPWSQSGNGYPPYEMVSEAHVASATFSAQYGLAAGAVTYKMSSGANAYHGDGFFINRNNFFDSVGFFHGPSFGGTNKAPTNHQNNYGFTLSGPATIPHLYNGKDRTFFLFTMDLYGEHGAQTSYHTLPTADMLNGDFSNFVDANGNLIKIFDPTTGQQFVCGTKLNVICTNRFSSVSKTILPLLTPHTPLRTGVGTYNGEQNNEAPYTTSTTNSNNNWGFGVDHNVSASQSIHFSMWNHSASNPSVGNNMFADSNELSSATANLNLARGYLLNYVKTISPNLLVTVGVDKIDIYNNSHVLNQSANFAPMENAVSFPGIDFMDGTFPITNWGNHTNVSATHSYDNAIVNNWMWTKGKHTFNFGGEVRRTLEDSTFCRDCGGDFYFSHKQTADPSNFNSNATGNAFASFLLGSVYAADRAWALPADLRSTDVSTYIQDDYKFSPRLTINAGLRWDIPVPFTAKGNDITFADFNMLNTAAGNLPGALTKLGTCAVGCSGINRAAIHWKDIGPRFGFSYELNDKTVLQGGYYTAFLGGGAYAFSLARVAQNYTNLLAGSYQSPIGSGVTPGYGDWDNKVINNPQQIPFSPTIANGQMVRQMNPKTAGIAPYAETWNFSVQRELPDQMFLMLAYVGNREIHLPSSLNQPNQLNPSYLALGNVLNDTVAQGYTDPGAAGLNLNPYPNFVNDYGGDPTNIPIIQALLPYPQFGGTDDHFDQNGTSFYRAFEAQIQKRFTHGYSFLSSLTLAQNWSDVDFGVTLQQNNPQNTFNQGAEWSVSSLNQKWNNKNMFTYVLPIGAGQRFLNVHGLADEFVGGWQVSGTMDYSAGNPVGIYENTNNVVLSTNANGDAQPRPNVVPGQPRKTYSYKLTRDFFVGKTVVQPTQFNTNAYSLASQFTFGNSARNYAGIIGPPNLMENFDAMKTFPMGERVKAILRVDYFNAFNRTQFGAGAPPVDNTFEDSTFGMVTSLNSNIINRQGQVTLRLEF